MMACRESKYRTDKRFALRNSFQKPPRVNSDHRAAGIIFDQLELVWIIHIEWPAKRRFVDIHDHGDHSAAYDRAIIGDRRTRRQMSTPCLYELPQGARICR